MRVSAKPENLIERILVALGKIPTPLMETFSAMVVARTIMVATKLEIFEALEQGSLTVSEVAKRCGTHKEATRKLMNVLVASNYLSYTEGERYSLAPVARNWLLKSSPTSLYDQMMFRFMEWHFTEHCEEYVRTGKRLDEKDAIKSDEQWMLYQRGMRSYASMAASELAKITPVPKGARDMLDIGGAHGYNSVTLCRKHPGLRSVILELPEAVKQSAPVLAEEGMGDRVVHRAGSALTDDLGTEEWDIVFIAQVLHHFDDATNRDLTRRVARALRSGGVFVIQEVIRTKSPKEAGQTGTLYDLFFGITSQAGLWNYEEMADWQREAGLVPKKPIPFRSAPGLGLQVAVKAVR